ncbi:dephospho-CoA kinase [Arthrobacter sedimenti]|uniref:dephospho-CoA kinase n=1 Tax=Arthrobacter sedimenti TaxID=2694931 RepID=UPI000B352E43|nr:dephospho-CoA kinase [Arthrobacter sedimenti]OUM42579.1 dephospho-CoA kinase [Arthrobacter agilis]
MLRIGLTGGIAAGKSVVARSFAGLGAVVVDADLLAREAVEPGSEGLDAVVAAFGPQVLAPDGGLDRPALGRLVFGDDTARTRLNAIIHPRVRARAAELIGAAPPDAVVLEDIPLLVETGQAARFHLVVVVDAPDDLRIQRMVGQRGMERRDAEQRIAAQASRSERLRDADAVLVNEGALEDLLAATEKLWHERILPFRDNLTAGRAAAGDPSTAAGLAGTSGLGRRVRAKIAAALPEGSGASVEAGSTPAGPAGSAGPAGPAGPAGHDDVVSASVRVTVERAEQLVAASDAVAAAGFPRAGAVEVAVAANPGEPAVHRGADPATDVTVIVSVSAAAA